MTQALDLPAAILLAAGVIAGALALLVHELQERRRIRRCGCGHQAEAERERERADATGRLYTLHLSTHHCHRRKPERY